MPIYDDDDDDDGGGGAVVDADVDELYDIIKMMLLPQTIFIFNIYICVSCFSCLLIIVFAFYHDISLYDMKRYDIT